MLQILLDEDSPYPKIGIEISEYSPLPLKIWRRDGIESLTTLEESEFKVPIDSHIMITRKGRLMPYNQSFFFFFFFFFLVIGNVQLFLIGNFKWNQRENR